MTCIDYNFLFHTFRERVADKLSLIEDEARARDLGIDNKNLTVPQKLHLCVYLIEKETNFTGEGVLLDLPIAEGDDNELFETQELCSSILKKIK